MRADARQAASAGRRGGRRGGGDKLESTARLASISVQQELRSATCTARLDAAPISILRWPPAPSPVCRSSAARTWRPSTSRRRRRTTRTCSCSSAPRASARCAAWRRCCTRRSRASSSTPATARRCTSGSTRRCASSTSATSSTGSARARCWASAATGASSPGTTTRGPRRSRRRAAERRAQVDLAVGPLDAPRLGEALAAHLPDAGWAFERTFYGYKMWKGDRCARSMRRRFIRNA